MNEHRVFGPPGTGKTTWATRQIERAFQSGGDHSVMVASFTKTAAVEIARRAGLIDYPQAGTLHALAWRQAGRPVIAESRIKDFNTYVETHGAPSFRVTGTLDSINDPEATGSTDGDEAMKTLQLLRGMQVQKNAWPRLIYSFEKMWSEWKNDCGFKDFTDVIEDAISYGHPPGGASIGFFDEVQDFTPLELSLVRRWGSRMHQVILIGDDDQCIYAFKGSTPDAFLDPPIPEENTRILAQSYRVPRSVHKLASAWIDGVSRRQAKEYAPRDAEGQVIHSSDTWKFPHSVVEDAHRYTEQGKSVMVLASCGYMLRPILAELRENAIPFHNPWAHKRGDWNPLARGSRGRVTATDRILAFLRPDKQTYEQHASLWTWEEMDKWLKHIKSSDWLQRGVKSELNARVAMMRDDFATLVDVFNDEASMKLFTEDGRPSLPWFQDALLARNRKPYEFPIRIALERSGKALRDKPKLTVGTIHSVKGAEADVVFLFPDLSVRGMMEWGTRSGEDAIRRMFYVGMTRAKETLVICQKSTMMGVEL